MEFVMKHPNIAAAQSYHNAGGMILRGPGASADVTTYNSQDVAIYDAIAKKGEELMPGYKYLVVYKDLYSAYGGELDWFYAGRGIYTYSNELWTPYLMFMKESTRSPFDNSSYNFDKYLLFKDGFVDWKEYDHPQYGKVEIGGFKKNFGRAHPGFLLESDAHRNMAFSIYHSYHTPKLSISEIKEKDLGGGLTEVTAVIANERLMPTHSSQDVKNKIERPDYITLNTTAKIVAGMIMTDKDLNLSKIQKNNPSTIEVNNIPGLGTVTVKWIVEGKGKYTVNVDSKKGGIATNIK
jgi:hypothetical protein